MDLGYGPEYEVFRAEVRRFLAAEWPRRGDEADLPRDQQAALFRRRAIEAGYAYRWVPRRYGGCERPTDVLESAIVVEEFRKADAPANEIRGQGASMLVPTLLEHGTEAQRERFIPPTLLGEMLWCQGYSEPGAGSDLASLQTRAELVGEDWVINGHKVWTSNAVEADFMFCLCRTEPDAGKHAGISYLLVDMRSPGIDVRPLRQMTGGADFNEVFLTDVRTPADMIVGKRGAGWIVSRSTLMHERALIGDPTFLLQAFDGLVELARGTRRGGRSALEDPRRRQSLVEIEGYLRAQQYTSYRQLSASAQGRDLDVMLPLLMAKLTGTDLMQRITRLAYEILGEQVLIAPSADEAGMVRRSQSPGSWVAQHLFSLGNSIAGGSSNIQRNIIGERGFGLPRDQRGN